MKQPGAIGINTREEFSTTPSSMQQIDVTCDPNETTQAVVVPWDTHAPSDSRWHTPYLNPSATKHTPRTAFISDIEHAIASGMRIKQLYLHRSLFRRFKCFCRAKSQMPSRASSALCAIFIMHTHQENRKRKAKEGVHASYRSSFSKKKRKEKSALSCYHLKAIGRTTV